MSGSSGAVNVSGELERLKEQVRQLELQRATAEAEAQRERTQRIAADAARAAAEADSLKQRALTFFASMRGMSGSASEHAAVSSDVSRRGAPAPEIVSAEV